MSMGIGLGIGLALTGGSAPGWQYTGLTATQNSWFSDTTLFTPSGSAPNQSVTHDPYARVAIITSDTSITLEAVPTNPSGTGVGDNDLADLGVWVNGVFNQTVLFNTTSFVKAQITITLPAGANKLVEIEERANLTGINANFNLVPVGAPVNSRRIVVYGDSIPAGFRAIPFYLGWVTRLRHRCGYGVLNYSISGDELVAGLTNLGAGNLANGIAVQAARLVAKCADGSTRKILWIELGTNDYALNHTTVATFQSTYASLVDAVHALDSSILIYCQTPITRAVETANGNGQTLPQFRTAISTVVSTRTAFCILVDGTTFPIGTTADGVHPVTGTSGISPSTGHEAYAQSVLAILGQPTVYVTATNSVSALVTSQSTVAQQSRIRSDTGISSAGGSPDLINNITDLGLLALRSNNWNNVTTSRPERSTFNARPAVKFDPTAHIEYLKPSLAAAADFKFLHGDGFTGIWVVQRIAAAANGRIIDNIDSLTTASCIGLAVAPVDSSRAIFIRVGNGAGSGTGFAWSLTSASNVMPVLGTTFVLDVRFSAANGLTARVNKTVFENAVAINGTISTSNPTHFPPSLGAFDGGTVGANQYLFEQQLHSAYLATADLDRVVDQLTADWIP